MVLGIHCHWISSNPDDCSWYKQRAVTVFGATKSLWCYQCTDKKDIGVEEYCHLQSMFFERNFIYVVWMLQEVDINLRKGKLILKARIEINRVKATF